MLNLRVIDQPINLKQCGKQILHYEDYLYLGVTVDNWFTETKEIEKRIKQAQNHRLPQLWIILWSKEITWNMGITDNYKKVEADDTVAIRRSISITSRERVRNEALQQQMDIEKDINEDIQKGI